MGDRRTVIAPLVDILAKPNGPRDRQLKFGEGFEISDTHDGFAFGKADHDGYQGYIAVENLGEFSPATHKISALASHVYTQPDMKSQEHFPLPLGARIAVLDQDEKFSRIAAGFIPTPHLEPLSSSHDVLETAKRYLDVPYLWGGNSIWGIDCSGLVQAAFEEAGFACPGDSHTQMKAIIKSRDEGQTPEPGELFFWKGHVALVEDAETFLHANAHHMSVVREPINAAIARIQTQGDGPVIARGRII